MNVIDISKLTGSETEQPKKKDKLKDMSAYLNREISFPRKSRFGEKEKERFYSELGLLLNTGVDIKTAFEIIVSDISNANQKKIIQAILQAIVNGATLNEAMVAYKSTFSSYEIQSVKIGEETGRLSEILFELARYYSASIKLRRQIVGVLTYPIVVIFLSLSIVYFMLCFVVPVFSDIFIQTGGELPYLTQLLIKMSDKSPVFFKIIFAFSITLYIIHRTQLNKDWYRHITSMAVLRIPGVGVLVLKIYLARFCQSMKLLTGAKVSIDQALGLVAEMIGFFPIEKSLIMVKREVVEKGKLLHESLSEHIIFPKKLISMIKLSEEVNQPEIIYEKLHQQYTAEIDHLQAILGKLIEPIFIIILGIFVGFILVAMYLPMFEMSGNF